MTADPLARPIFVVAPPRAGSRFVAGVLGTSPDCWRLGRAAGALLAPVPELDPPDGSRAGRLVAADCTAPIRHRLRAHLQVQFARRDRARSGDASGVAAPRLLQAAPRSALSVPFLDAAFPDARFVYVHRPPTAALAESLLLWRAGSAITYPDLPGWKGPAWSFSLVPGWPELIDRPLPEIVTEQWVRAMRVLTGDLEALAPDRWCVVERAALRPDFEAEATRLIGYLGLAPAPPGSEPPATLGFPSADLDAAREELEPYLERTQPLAEHAADWLAEPQRTH